MRSPRKPSLPQRPEIREQTFQERFVPAMILQAGGDGHDAKHGARVVIAVIGHQPGGGIRAPTDETISALFGIGARTAAYVGIEENVIKQITGDDPAGLMVIQSGVERQDHGAFRIAIRAQRQTLNLLAIKANAGSVAFQDAKRAIAHGFVRAGCDGGFTVCGEGFCNCCFAPGRNEQTRVCDPAGISREGGSFKMTRQSVFRTKSCNHDRRANQFMRRILRVQSRQNGLPDGLPITRGRIAAGDKTAQLGGGNKDIPSWNFKKQGLGVGGKAKNGGIVSSHARDHQEGMGCNDWRIMAIRNGENVEFGQGCQSRRKATRLVPEMVWVC